MSDLDWGIYKNEERAAWREYLEATKTLRAKHTHRIKALRKGYGESLDKANNEYYKAQAPAHQVYNDKKAQAKAAYARRFER